jgi:predicted nucleotidyltransferase
LHEKLAELCQLYGVADLYAFGSRAGEIAAKLADQPGPGSLPESDLDIGVYPEDRGAWTPEKKVELTIELEDLFGVGRIDLVLLPEADPFLALDIIRGELLYTSDPDRQARYELFVLRRAGDLLPFQKARHRMILEEGAR